MRTQTKTIMILLISSLILIGCKKEGEPGPAGTDGKEGNANVQSVTLTANTASNWVWNSSAQWREATWPGISILDQNAISTGAVMLYQSDGAGGYFALPASITFGGVTENDWFIYSQGTLSVVIQNTNGSDPISQIMIPTSYKLVVIPSTAKLANPDIDLTNYYEVKSTFNIE